MKVPPSKHGTLRRAEEVVCPLCGQTNTLIVKQVDVGPIAKYWRDLQYDLDVAFPQLRNGLWKRQCVDCDLRFFYPEAVGGPDLYSALGKGSVYYGAAKWEYLNVLQHLSKRPKGGALLEFGCGPGHFLERVTPYYTSSLGIDFNEDAVHEAQSRGLNVGISDLADLEQVFDTIVAFQVIEHVPDPGATLRRLLRLLRPGGELIVAVPNEDSLLGVLERNCLNVPPHHTTCWTKAAFNSIARLFLIDLEAYSREPFNLELYLCVLHERFDRYVASSNTMLRPWLSLLRRAYIAWGLLEFDQIRKYEVGHTHIAFFRKPAILGAE